ncbi:MAG: phosphate ABC transporter substrate-binding protein [archaeon]|nr:phosphate ABC transporter substrate-binding protein [archaeon]
MNTKIAIVSIVAVVAIVAVGVYCTQNNDDSETIAIQGSTTVSPYMLKVQETYEKDHKVKLQITSNGSGTGASAAINGTANLAMLSRDLKSSEKEAGLIQTVIGLDGIMAIVNKDSGVTNLTSIQLEKVFSGEITNWKDVGGNDKAINLISREEGSGTRDGFEEALKKADAGYALASNAIFQTSTNAVISTVNNTTGAIGYISIGYAKNVGDNTTVLSLDGVSATEENVLNGTYSIQRNLVLATKGEATGATADLITWILGADGQALLTKCGFISKA